MLLASMCSRNLHEIQVSEIGLLFPGLCMSLIFNICVTFPWFQSDGTLPEYMDFVNMMVSMSQQICICSLRILPVMFSGRAALFVFIFLINL